MNHSEKGETVPILFTMDRILQYLAGRRQLVPLKELCQVLGIPRSTANRILFTLYQLAYLEKDARKPAYRLRYNSPISHSIEKRHRETLNQAAQEPLQQLARKLGETVKLSIWDRESCSVEVLCSEIGNNNMHIQVPVGIHFPWHAGAASKLLLAFDKEIFAEIQESGPTELESYTPNTITDMSNLQAKLEQVRQEGWAYDEQEYQEGIEALACPVFYMLSEGTPARLLGALSIPHVANSTIRERIYKEKKQILDCATQISKEYAMRVIKNASFRETLDNPNLS